MNAAQYLRFTVIGVAILGAGGVLADDLPLPTDPAQQRERMRSMSPEDRTATREQMQERVRNMTAEEQKLMRETRSDARTPMENQQGEGTRQRSRDGSGGGGGRGMSGGRGR